MRTVSRKTAALASGAIVAAGAVAAGVYVAVNNHQAQASPGKTAQHVAAKLAPPPRPPQPPRPLRLLSVTPADGSRGVDGAGNITVTFNKPLPATAALPRLSPAVAGNLAARRRHRGVHATDRGGGPHPRDGDGARGRRPRPFRI